MFGFTNDIYTDFENVTKKAKNWQRLADDKLK